MADPRDFMLSVGAKLVDSDIAKIGDQISAEFKKIPPLEIRAAGAAQLKRDMESGAAVTKKTTQSIKDYNDWIKITDKSISDLTKALDREAASESKARKELEAKAAKEKSAAEATIAAAEAQSRAWQESASKVRAAMAVMHNAIMEVEADQKMLAMSAAMNATKTAQDGSVGALATAMAARQFMQNHAQADSIDSALNAPLGKRPGTPVNESDPVAGIRETAAQMSVMQNAVAKGELTWEKYTPALLKGVEAHRKMLATLPQEIAGMKGFADEASHMISTFAMWSAAAHIIEGTTHSITKGFTDAVHSEKEQNITSQYYKAAGSTYTPAMSDEAMQGSIMMATRYGEEVTHVQESVGLWAKITKGELAPALNLTNSAMKLNAVSGMNMEEIYRDTIAVFGQLQEPLSRVNNLYDIATGLALKYGGGIQTLGSQSDDAVKQMMDGMTRLTAIMTEGLGRGTKTLAEIGAQVAIVSHLTNESGDAVAGHLAAAFAKMEAGKLHQSLHDIGVETRDNANLIEDLGNKWGKAMPIIQAGGVRSQDLEFVKTLIDNYKLYHQAVIDAQKAEKDGATDSVFLTILQTTDMKLKQLKAGWESLGITIGREALGPAKQFLDFTNGSLIPSLINDKSAIINVALAIGQMTLAFGGLSLVRSVGAATIGAISTLEDGWKSLGTTTSVASRAMSISLEGYQREALQTLLKVGTVDAELEQAIKVLAAEYNISIDAMIIKMREAAMAAGTMGSAFVSDAELIGNSVNTMADRTGIATLAMRTEFSELAIQAESTAAAIGTAFVAALGPIGAVIAGGMIAWDVKNGITDMVHHKDDEYLRSQADGGNAQPIIKRLAEVNKAIDSDNAQLHDLHAGKGVMPSGLFTASGKPITRAMTKEESISAAYDLHKDEGEKQKYAYALFHRLPTDADKFASDKKKVEDALSNKTDLSHLYVAPPTVNQPLVDPTGKVRIPKIKGIASANALNGLDIDKIATSYDMLQKRVEGVARATDNSIAVDKRRIQVFGDSKKNVDALVESLKSKNAIDTALSYYAKNEINDYAWEKKHLEKTMPKPGTTANADQQRKINELQRKIDALDGQNIARGGNIDSNNNEIFDVLAAQGDKTLRSSASKIMSDYNTSKSALETSKTPNQAFVNRAAFEEERASDIIRLEAMKAQLIAKKNLTAVEAAEIPVIQKNIDTVKAALSSEDSLEALHNKITTESSSFALALLFPYDAPLQTAIKAVKSLDESYQSQRLQWQIGGAKDFTELDTWKALQEQIIQTTYVQAEYARRSDEFKKTASFQAVGGAIDTVSKSLETSAYNGLNKKPDYNMQEAQYQERINQLTQEKTLLNGAVYQARRDDIDRQIRALTLQEQKIKDSASKPPSLMTGMIQGIEKTIIDSTLKNAEASLKKTVTEAFLGPAPKDAATKTHDAMASYKLTTETKLVPAIDKFGIVGDHLLAGMNSAGMKNGSYSFGTPLASASSDPSVLAQAQAATDGKTATQANTIVAMQQTTALNMSQKDIKTNTMSLDKLTKGLGALGGIAGGFATGGLAGGLEAGSGVMSLLGTIAPKFGPWGMAVAGAVGIGASLIHHDDPTKMPDKYDTANYGQFGANVNGSGFGANGQSFTEDSSISKVTGGLSEGAYIEKYIKGKSAAQLTSVFGDNSAAIQKMFGGFQEGGGLTNLHNGNLSVSGSTYNWQDINTQATDAFTAITKAADSMNQALAPIISISAYGKGSNSATFSPYYTPGYGDTSSLSSIPYPSLYAQSPSTAVYNAPPSNGTRTIQTTVNLDGQVIAQNTSQYRSQQIGRGFAADS